MEVRYARAVSWSRLRLREPNSHLTTASPSDSFSLAALVSSTQQTVIMLIVVTILIYRAERHQVFSGTVAAFPAGGVGAEAGTGPGGPRIGSMCDRDRWRRDPGTLPMSRRAPGPHPKPSATSVCVITDPLGPRGAWGGEEQNMRLPRPSTFAFVLTLDVFEFRASTTTTGWTVFRPTTRPVPP